MTVLRRLLLAALIAGGASGALLGIAQVAFITPFILEAEAHEHRSSVQPESPHHAWEPKKGFERNAYTVLFTTLTGVGFAFVLNAGMLLRGGTGFTRGLIWGCAGFVVFSLAPALGLPPELPGAHAADLPARQTWWIGTVVATALGLSGIVLSRRPLLRAFGVVVLLVPHLIGAPVEIAQDESAIAHLKGAFAATSLTTMLVFWLILGTLSSLLQGKLLTGRNRTSPPARSLPPGSVGS